MVVADACARLSHVLVAAPSGHGADAVLEAMLASLVSRRSPSQLGLIVIGGPHCLPAELLGVPHVIEGRVDPHDEAALPRIIRLVRQELDERMAGWRGDEPDIVLVAPELTDIGTEHADGLGAVMLHGPKYNMRVLAASRRQAEDLVRD